MPTSACCSAITSGVAMSSVDLHSNHAVVDRDGERLDRDVGGQVQRLAGPQVEDRAVPRALDRAVLEVELALQQVAVVVRAAVLDGEQLAAAVDDADLEVLPLGTPETAGRELGHGTDVDHGAHGRRISDCGSRSWKSSDEAVIVPGRASPDNRGGVG